MEDKKDWLRRSMAELSAYLLKPPAEIQYTFTELPGEYESDIHEILQDIPDSVHDWEHELLHYYADKQKHISNTLIICPKDSHLAKLCLRIKPDAPWGLATSTLSFVYEIRDKYIVWHETLHLLGADDCYDLSKNDRGPSCDLPNCVMQYEATMTNVGTWPFLCKENLQRIRNKLGT